MSVTALPSSIPPDVGEFIRAFAAALTGRVPEPNPQDAGWWYPMAERRIRLAGDRSAPLACKLR